MLTIANRCGAPVGFPLAARIPEARRRRAGASGCQATAALALLLALLVGGVQAAPILEAKIGDGLAGSLNTLAGPVYEITGSGSDVWGTADDCYFVYQPFSASQPLDIWGRVGLSGFVGGSNAWRKAGIMIRQSLTDTSRGAEMLIAEADANGINTQIRLTDGASKQGSSNTGTRVTYDTPVYLRLEYLGDGTSFRSYYKANLGDPWIEQGNAAFNVLTTAMTGTIYGGLFVTAHDSAQQTTVQFGDVNGFILAAPDHTLTWNGSTDNWGTANWDGGDPGEFPTIVGEVGDIAIVNSGAVTVAADQGAYSLTVNGGSVAVGSGNTLRLLTDVTSIVAGGVELQGGTLNTRDGSLVSLVSNGGGTLDTNGYVQASHLVMAANDTFVKNGPGTLVFDQSAGANVLDDSNTVRVNGGELRMQALSNPLSAAELELNGATFTVTGAAAAPGTIGPNFLNASQFLTGISGNANIDLNASGGGAYDPVTLGTFTGASGVLAMTPDRTGRVTMPLSFQNNDAAGGFDDIFTRTATENNFAALFTGYFTPNESGVWQFRLDVDDAGSMYIDLNGDGDFAETNEEPRAPGGTATFSTASLTAGTTYRVAIGFREGTGTERIRASVQAPSGGGLIYIDPTDWRQAGLWAGNATIDQVDMTDTDVTVLSDSGINAVTEATADFGSLVIHDGATLATSGGVITFADISFVGSAGRTAGIATSNAVTIPLFNDGGVATNFVKSGPGYLSLPNVTATGASSFEVTAGALVTEGPNPVGSATNLYLSGGTFGVSGPAGNVASTFTDVTVRTGTTGSMIYPLPAVSLDLGNLAIENAADLTADGGRTTFLSTSFGTGSTLIVGTANGVRLGATTTNGDANIGGTGRAIATTYNDQGTPGTMRLYGSATLALDNTGGGNVVANNTVFRVEGTATLSSIADNPLGAAGSDVVLAGGTLKLHGESAGLVAGALRHFGYHVNNDAVALNLDNNGGVLGGTPPSPALFTSFYGQTLLTSGPQGNGLEFDNDAQFIATGAIGRVDNYSNLFLGYLHVDAANAGDWRFRHTRSDDIAGFWLDKNGDGVFQLSGAFGDTGGGNNQKGELIVYEDDNDYKTVDLAAGDYMVAFLHREGTGGSTVEFRFQSPTMGAEAVVKPSDAAQAGIWNYMAYQSINATNVDVSVVANSNLSATTDGSAALGRLSFDAPSVLSVGGAVGGVTFIDTTLNTGGLVGLNTASNVTTGPLAGNGNVATFVKQGPADMILNAPGTGLENTFFEAQAGRTIVVGSTPVTGARLHMSGGELVLSSPDGSDVTFDNPVRSTADGTLTAGSGGVGSPGGVIALTDLTPIEGSIIQMRVTDAAYILLPNGVSAAGLTTSNTLRQFGYHINNDPLVMDLDNNGGMYNGGEPYTFTSFYGKAWLTSGPGNRGLDFNNDQDFIDTGAIGRGDNYSNLFLGTLHVSAADVGNWTFRIEDRDDPVGIWIDLNQNGIFESSTPGLGSDRGEQITWNQLDTNKVVDLSSEGDYMIAFTHREGTGGSQIHMRFQSPTMTTMETVQPSDPAQAGLWSYTAAPGGLDIAQGEVRTLGALDLGTLILSPGGVLYRASLNPADRNITVSKRLVVGQDLNMTGGEVLTTVGAELTINSGSTLYIDHPVNAGILNVQGDLVRTGLGAQGDVTVTQSMTLDSAMVFGPGSDLHAAGADIQVGATGILSVNQPLVANSLQTSGDVSAPGGTLGNLQVDSGTTTLAGNMTVTGTLSGSGGTLAAANTLTLDVQGAVAFGGTVRVDSGHMTFNPAAASAIQDIRLAPDTQLTFGGATLINSMGTTVGPVVTGPMALSAASNLQANASGDTLTASSTIDATNFNVAGPGTVALTQNLTVAGGSLTCTPDAAIASLNALTIDAQAGTLDLDGQLTVAGGTLTVNTPAAASLGQLVLTPATGLILGGTAAATFDSITAADGTFIQGAATLAGGMTIGSSPGTLSVVGSFTMAPGSTYHWKHDGTGQDLVAVSGSPGTVDVSSAWNLGITLAGGIPDGNYDLFTFPFTATPPTVGPVNVVKENAYAQLITSAAVNSDNDSVFVTLDLAPNSTWTSRASLGGTIDWHTAGNWNSGVPTAGMVAIVKAPAADQVATVLPGATGEAETLIVDNGGTVLVSGGASLQVGNGVWVEPTGTLTVNGRLGVGTVLPTVTPQDFSGLVAYWPFNEGTGTTTADLSGGGHTATLNNGPTWSSDVAPTAYANPYALSFDGSNDNVTVAGYKGVTGTEPRTLLAWIKTSSTGDNAIASWGTNSTGQKWTFRTQDDNGTAGAIRIEVNGGYLVGSTVVGNNQWHQVAVVFPDDGTPDVTDCLLYVDGVLESNSASQAQSINTASGIDVRIALDHLSRYFNGIIDDVALWDRALSATEIQDLYQGSGGLLGGTLTTAGTTIFGPNAILDIPRIEVVGGTTQGGELWPPSARVTLQPQTTLRLADGQLTGGFNLTNPSTTAGSYALEVENGLVAANLIGPTASLRKSTAGAAFLTGAVDLDTIRMEDGSLTISDGPRLTANTVTVTGGSLKSARENTIGTLALQGGTTTLTRNTTVTTALVGSADLIADGDFDLDLSTAGVGFGGTLRVTNSVPATSGNLFVNLPAGTPLSTGLVGYWSFDPADISGTTAFDRSGFGNDAILQNNPAQVPGIAGGALSFNGSNQFVEVPHSASLDVNSAFSVGVWAQTTDPGGWFRTLVSKYGYTGTQTAFWGLGWLNTNRLGFVIRDGSGTRTDAQAPDARGLDGAWHYFMGVRGNGMVQFYMDGSLVVGVPDGTGSVVNTKPVTAAMHNNQYVQGIWDEMAVWDRALSDTEAMAIYQRGLAGLGLGQVSLGHLRLDPDSQITLGGAGEANFASVGATGGLTIDGNLYVGPSASGLANIRGTATGVHFNAEVNAQTFEVTGPGTVSLGNNAILTVASGGNLNVPQGVTLVGNPGAGGNATIDATQAGEINFHGGLNVASGTLTLNAPAAGQLPAGALAHWRLDEASGTTAANASSTTPDGAVVGNALWQPAGGRIGGAMQFDGATDIRVPFDAAFGLNNFTVSAWVNVAQNQSNGGILGTRFGGDNTFDVKVRSSDIHGDVGSGTAWINTGVDITAAQGGDISLDEWHLVTYVIDDAAKQFRLYLDGALARTISGYSGTPLLMKAGQEMRLGNSSGTERLNNGLLDEVLVYDRALSPSEVQDLYRAGLGGGYGAARFGDLTMARDTNLVATAAPAGFSTASVGDNTTMTGDITIDRRVTVNSTASGTLLINGPTGADGDLRISDGLVYEWSFAKYDHDLINILGDLHFDNSFTLSIFGEGGNIMPNDWVPIFLYSGILDEPPGGVQYAIQIGNLADPEHLYIWDASGAELFFGLHDGQQGVWLHGLYAAAIPEPGTLSVLALGALALLRRRRRARAKVLSCEPRG